MTAILLLRRRRLFPLRASNRDLRAYLSSSQGKRRGHADADSFPFSTIVIAALRPCLKGGGMSFWQSLGTYVTRTAMPLKRLQLQGRLQDQLSPQNRQGPARISAVSYSDAVHIWDMNQYLSTVPLADQRARDDMNVYWLPWKQHEVTTVMMHDLNLSGCNYFLTSEFSGCRFNIADDRLQHVAWGAGPRRDGTSIDRNYALLASWQATTMPTRVRTYSYSKLPNPDANGSLVQDGYGAMDIHGNMSPNARALVIGWKISNEWRFYMQQWVAGSDLAIFRRIEA